MQGGGLTDWLSSLPILAIGFGTLAVMLVAAAAGQLVRQLQARRARRVGDESEPSVAQEGYLLGGVLGLLGLLLAFSFGMVLNRYETRRELVIAGSERDWYGLSAGPTSRRTSSRAPQQAPDCLHGQSHQIGFRRS